MSDDLVIGASLGYVAALFAVAAWADRRARRGRRGWLRSPWVYTLSLSIYCTAWTFYGAVGYAARSGLEFATIYLGPTLVLVGWWWLLRKLVRIARAQRITSVADLLSSRYGKSTGIGVLVTLLAVIGVTPYVALQLQSVTLSFAVIAERPATPEALRATGIVVAGGLALFTILFGTRTLDAEERHHGVVMAVAIEAVVKLVALLAVGAFVVWGAGGGVAATLARIDASPIAAHEVAPGRWTAITALSAAAFVCLPRMFQVLVVENADERHLAVASWACPLYLLLMSLFVVPIAALGLETLPEGNPDLLVLTLPLALGQDGLALLAFLGGFSSATSMVIVAALALSTMVSNHIVLPAWLALRPAGAPVPRDVRRLLLLSRRAAILGVLGLGYLYWRVSGGGAALAEIGLTAFAAIAQVAPAMLFGLFWRGATRGGAALGIALGLAVWAWTLLLPSLGVLPAEVVALGPWGAGWLRPGALFGLEGLDPMVHATLWSLALNAAAVFGGSAAAFPSPLERLQAAQFVHALDRPPTPAGPARGAADAEDLLVMAQRLLGGRKAQALFRRAAAEQGRADGLPEPTPAFVERLERELAGSVGAAMAHAMMAQMGGGASLSVGDLMAMADETAQVREHRSQLEAKSAELSRAARALAEANAQLTRLAAQKDAFLGQVSHELRTPMTSIRAFSEILMEPDLAPEERARFAGVIHDEGVRLTRLLDDLLDLSVLEQGRVRLNEAPARLDAVLDRAVAAAGARGLEVRREPERERLSAVTDADRLAQVFINLVSNAAKYCDAERPCLTIRVREAGAWAQVDFVDNGSGVPEAERAAIFEKFARLPAHAGAEGAGLGLAICREIMARLGGTVGYLPGEGGAAFRVSLPLRGEGSGASEAA